MIKYTCTITTHEPFGLQWGLRGKFVRVVGHSSKGDIAHVRRVTETHAPTAILPQDWPREPYAGLTNVHWEDDLLQPAPPTAILPQDEDY